MRCALVAAAALVGSAAFAPSARADLVLRTGADPSVQRFEQVHRGLPVLGRGVVRRSASQVASALEVDLPRAPFVPLPPERAVRAAQSYTRVPLSVRDAHLVVLGSELAYLVAPRAPPNVPSAPRIVVSATTGRVLEARDAARGARALVYAQNPVRTPSPELLELPLGAVGPTLAGAALVARSCVDEGATRKLTLAGAARDVRTCALVSIAKADAAGDFVAPPVADPLASDPFAEASLYYHAARGYAFFQALGGGAAPPIREVPLDLVAGVRIAAGLLEGDFAKASRTDLPLEPFPSAMYLPGDASEGQVFRDLYGASGGALWFGQGRLRDFAYDGDVVVHELTHAVLDATLHIGGLRITEHGTSAEPEAIEEALADYFSSALSGDPLVGEYASGEGAATRTLDNQAACAEGVTGRRHEDSQVFSGALWRVRGALPEASRTAMDRAVYRALFLSPGRADLLFDEIASLVLASMEGELPSAAPLLKEELTKRGVLPRCTPLRLLSPSQTVAGPFASPGTDALGTDLAPGIVQLRADLPPGTRRVMLRFAAAQVSASLFGRQDAPFAPVVLAAFDAPLRFERDGARVVTNASARARAEGEGEGTRTAAVEVPAGARTLFLQIANEGAADGIYDTIGVAYADDLPPGEVPATAASSFEGGGGCGVARSRDATSLGCGLFSMSLLLLRAGSRRLRSRRRPGSR